MNDGGDPSSEILTNADSYVKENVPDDNFGTEAYLYVTSQTDRLKRIFLKFDISSLPSDAVITLAKLKAYCHVVNNYISGVSDVQARRVSVDTWTETGITWTNQPAYGTVEDTVVPEVGWKEWTVTSWIQNEWAGDKIVSICLRNVIEDYDGVDRRSVWRSREFSDYEPRLYIEYIVKPTVTTQAATGIGFDSPSAHATLHGTITDTGGENPGERGFDWDYDSGAPYSYSWTETDSYGVGAFSHQVTGLTEGVTVYFRAKAHNSVGWGYGGELSFKTPKAWTKTLTDSLGLLDATVKKVHGRYKTLTEALGLVDVFSRTWTIYRTHSELLGLADTVSKEPSKTFTESLGLVDTVAAVRGLVKVLTELLGMSDTVIKSPSLAKTESLGLVDTYSRVWDAHRTYSELLGLADSVQKETSKTFPETLGLVDTVIKAPSIVKSEPLGLVDVYSRVWTAYRIHSELLGLADSVQKQPSKTFPETLGLVDTYSRVWGAYRTYSELLGLADTVITFRAVKRTFTETLGLLDSISYVKNPTVLAKLIQKYLQLEYIGGE